VVGDKSPIQIAGIGGKVKNNLLDEEKGSMNRQTYLYKHLYKLGFEKGPEYANL
jgi:hypothetical protein